MANSSIRFDVRFSKTGDSILEIRYSVDSQLHVLHLLNRIYVTIPVFKMTPDIIYSELEENRTVHFMKKIPAVPAGLSPTSLICPYATRVAPGQRFEEVVHVPLPLEPFTAYPLPPPPPPTEHKDEDTSEPNVTPEPKIEWYRAVRFTLGYVIVPAGSEEYEQTVGDQKVPLFRTPPGVNVVFEFFVSEPVKLDIPVIVHPVH